MAIQPQATRSLRRIKVKTPGARLVIHYRKRKPSILKCSNCKVNLIGIPRERPAVLRNLTASQRKISRPYGGNLCSKCSRETLIKKAKNSKELPLEIGQVCIKLAGREGGKVCAIVDMLDSNFVLIDGQVKRRKCNILHLQTLDKKIDIKKNENSEKVKEELKKLGFEIKGKKVKEIKKQKESSEKPKEEKNAKRSTKKVR